nr:unnamed protein product [Spirometra erinaceieuropaei]
MYVTFAVDIMVACLLTVEMGTKMCIQGLFAPSAGQDLNQLIKKQIAAKSLGVGVDTKRNKAYFQQSWNCFDASMTLLKSTGFNIVIMLLVLANAITAAGQHFNHHRVRMDDSKGEIYMDGFYFAELGFTVVFDLEAIFKIWCLGWRSYWSRSLFKFELMLCIGTSLHCIPQLYRTEFTYLSVLRIVRLIKASPMLEEFCFKIFGPGKKLGSLVLFTSCLLVITSTFSLQLFCFFQAFDAQFDRFETFPKAFMSMFQILTQKGWVAVMHDTMDVVNSNAVITGVAIYFVFYHLFVTLIVLSLFIAVILDNLELDEDIKKLKQLKMREISAETQQKLPLRLRIFEKFPNRPQMIRLTRLVSDFLLPKIRDSFMRQFAAVSAIEEVEDEAVSEILAAATTMASISAGAAMLPTVVASTRASGDGGVRMLPSAQVAATAGGWRGAPSRAAVETAAAISCSREIRRKVHGLQGEEKVRAIIYLLSESNKTRLQNTVQSQPTSGRSLLSTQQQIRLERRNLRSRSGGSMSSAFLRRDGTSSGHLNVTMEVTEVESRGPVDRSGHYDIKVLQQKAQMAEIKRTQQEEELRENHPFFDRPLFTLGRQSRLRHLCSVIVRARHKIRGAGGTKNNHADGIHKILGFVTYLDWSMLVVTILSCISMALETPQRRLMNTPELQVGEYIFFVGMTIEITLKILADGFVFTPNALLKDFGGFLDLFTYSLSLIFVSYLMRVEKLGPSSTGQLLLVLRCLRPLRIFCLVPQMRRVVYELVRGFREILMVTVLLVIFVFIFAVYGVHMFGGRLAICNDRSITRKEDCKGVFYRELAVTKLKSFGGPAPKILVPRVWANPRNFNFDNIGSAMLALFEVLSLEGWVEIRDVIRARIGPTHVIYIHLFVFIGCMIGLTLFVGVVIANYKENKGTALLTVDQRRWLDLKGRIKLTQPLHIPPRPKLRQEPGQLPIPGGNVIETTYLRFRCVMYDITQHIVFKRLSAVLVLANSALLFFPFNEKGSETDPGVLTRYKVQIVLAVIFTLMFTIECVMKIIALTFNGYWQSKRNRFDMLVSILGLGWIVMHFSMRPTPQHHRISNNFGWTVQMLRFLTIAGKHVTLKMLMLTVIMSMYKSLFILTSMVVLMLVYALMGVVLFGSVKFGDNLGRHANFHNAFRATILLSRIITGEDWNKIMHDCMIQPPFCKLRETFWETNCGNAQASLAYFCTFYVIITYVMLNVLVAIIMENFSLFYSNDEDAIMSYSDIRNFQQAWNIIDVHRKGVVKAYYVRFLLRLIPRDRVGFDLSKKRDKQLFKEMCYEVETLRGGRDKDVSFHDVLMVLAYRTVDITKTLQLEELIAREELEYAIEEEVARQTIATWIERCIFRKRQKHGHLHFSMYSMSERLPGSGHEEARDASRKECAKGFPSSSSSSSSSSFASRVRQSKIKFGSPAQEADEPTISPRVDSFENPSSSTTRSPTSTPPLANIRPIMSPVTPLKSYEASSARLQRADSFQDNCMAGTKVNGRIESLLSKPYLADGIVPNSLSRSECAKSTISFPSSPLTFIDSCGTATKMRSQSSLKSDTHTAQVTTQEYDDPVSRMGGHSKHQNPEAHSKSHRLVKGVGSSFTHRRSMRTPKTYTSLSDVVEDSDEGLVSSVGMPSIKESHIVKSVEFQIPLKSDKTPSLDTLNVSNRSSIYDNLPQSVDCTPSFPDRQSLVSTLGEPNVEQVLKSAAAALLEHTTEHASNTFSPDGRVPPSDRHLGLHEDDSQHLSLEAKFPRSHYDKRSVSTTPGRSTTGEDVDIIRNTIQNSCQDVKSWWMKQITPRSPNESGQEGQLTVPTGIRFQQSASAEGKAAGHAKKESFPPSVFASTSHLGVAGRIRRRVQSIAAGQTINDSITASRSHTRNGY